MKREVAFAGDDEVIQQADVEKRRRLGDARRQAVILRARFSGPRRMIVDENELRRQQLERPLDHQPVVDHRPLHAPLADALPLDEAVRGGQIDRPALLVGERLELRAHEAHGLLARVDHGRRAGNRLRHAPPQLDGDMQPLRPPEPQPADHAQAGPLGRGDAFERTAEGLEQLSGRPFVVQQQRQQLLVGQRGGTARLQLIGQGGHAERFCGCQAERSAESAAA